jgi:hypothetical protein
LQLTPEDEAQISVSPWPFIVEELQLLISGSAIPQAFYADRHALAKATSQTLQLHWRLAPSKP